MLWCALILAKMSAVNFRLILAIFLSTSYSLSQVIDETKIERLCPRPVGGWSMPCDTPCNIDNDCPADRMCCRLSTCATYCAEPLYVDQNGLIPKEKLFRSRENNFQNFVDSKVNQVQIIKTAVDEKQETDMKNLSPPSNLIETPRLSETRNEIPNIGCFDECALNVDCESGYYCVKVGCRNVCKLDSLNITTPSVNLESTPTSVGLDLTTPSASLNLNSPSSSSDLAPTSVGLDSTSSSASVNLNSPSSSLDLIPTSVGLDSTSPSVGLDLTSLSIGLDLTSPSVAMTPPSSGLDLTSPSVNLDLNSPSSNSDLTSRSFSLDLTPPSFTAQVFQTQNTNFRMNRQDLATPEFMFPRNEGFETQQFSDIPITQADPVVDSLRMTDLTKDVCINECFNHFDCRNGFCINIGCHTFCKASI
ncbi:extracellular matrix protein A-like [Mytilus edulis]|uniref:extracellular matrix protein A-like n=1 Tax=Mytilus edulis TaxID=6550 RepID=UPI0039EE3AB9